MIDPRDLAQAREIIEKELVGKKHEDFFCLNDKERHFLFTTRMHYENSKKPDGIPFTITERQFVWLKDLIAQVKNPELLKASRVAYLKKVISACKREVTLLKTQLKNAEEDLEEKQAELKELMK